MATMEKAIASQVAKQIMIITTTGDHDLTANTLPSADVPPTIQR